MVLVVAAALMSGCGDTTEETNNAVVNNGANNGDGNNGDGNNGDNNGDGNNNGDNNGGGPVDPDTDCSDAEDVSGRIDSDTILSASTGCYLSSSGISVVNGATLTIEPGVVITFEENTGLLVDGGRLNAEGTADEPIVFTGADEVPGYWSSVVFEDSDSFDNILDHVVIEYAEVGLSLQGRATTRVAVNNSTIQHSAGFGIHMSGDTGFHEFADNSIVENAAPMSLQTWMIGWLDSSSSFTGNETDEIEVRGGTTGGEDVWPAVDVPFHVTDSMTITSDGFVTIEAGNEFRFAENTDFTVDEGRLTVAGEEDREVVFTAEREQPGFWTGLVFDNTDSTDNVLEYAVIEYAGKNGAGLELDRCCGNYVSAAVRNTVFRHNDGLGFKADDSSSVSFRAFENNTSTSNSGAAGSIHASIIDAIADSNTFSGNDEDYVLIQGTINDDATWRTLDVPYLAADDLTVDEEATVTIEAGNDIAFAEGTNMEVDEGVLVAIGEDGNEIQLRGERDEAGFWQGLVFYNSDSTDNELDHVIISHGGGNGSSANLTLNDCCGNSTSVTLNNLQLTDSASAGMSIDDASVTLRGCANITTENVQSDVTGHVSSLSELNDMCE